MTRFVIIDDREAAADAELLPSFVHTITANGLTDMDVSKALTILKREPETR